MKNILLFALVFFLGAAVFSQADSTTLLSSGQVDAIELANLPPTASADTPQITNTPPTSSDAGAPEVMSVMTSYEILLSLSVLIFGLIVMGIELYLMKVNKFDQNQTIKFVLVTLIITSALFLIAAGFSNNQIAPAMGLLGTVAGYLLGRGDTPVNETTKKP